LRIWSRGWGASLEDDYGDSDKKESVSPKIAFISVWAILGSFFLSELPGIRNLLDRYLMDPWAAIGGSLALLFRPPLMDILPMYVLFSFLTPAAFGAARRWGWKTVLFVSFSAWIIAQTHVRDMLVNSSKDLPFVR
jgi:hypothetical protein